MSRGTSIEWTRGQDGASGATWNPLIAEDRLRSEAAVQSQLTDLTSQLRQAKNRWACVRKSPGCDNCYASILNVRYGGTPFAPIGAKEPNARVVLNRSPKGDSSLTAPDRWRKPTTIFVCSMTDWAGDWVSLEDMVAILDVAARNRHHTFQFLTKRPERSLEVLDRWLERVALDRAPEHMWFGTTIEMQSLAWRAGLLAQHRCSVRFVSAEPLIGALDLRGWLGVYRDELMPEGKYWLARNKPNSTIDWLIVGGESGPGARPMAVAWARRLIQQSEAAGVPVFLKQWGNWAPHRDGLYTGTSEVDGETVYRYKSKEEAGRTLDGRTYDAIPARPWMRELAEVATRG